MYEEIYASLGLIMGAVFGVFGMISYRLIIKRLYPIQVPVITQRGNHGIVWNLDERAKMTRSKAGFEALQLRSAKKMLKPARYEYVSLNTAGKPVYPVYSTTSGQYFPVTFTDKVGLESIEDKGAKNWSTLLKNYYALKYMPSESFLARYAPFIMNTVFAGMVIFFVIYFSSKIESASAGLSSASNALTNALMVFKGAPAPP